MTIESFSGIHAYKPECAALEVEHELLGEIWASLDDEMYYAGRVTEALDEKRCPRPPPTS